MSANLEQIYDRLTSAINDIMDSTVVSDHNKQRYQEMVEQMTKTILHPVNKKISFLTFKIVEETIKRACLRVQMDAYVPIEADTVNEMKKLLAEGRPLPQQHKPLQATAGSELGNKSGYNNTSFKDQPESRKGSALSRRGIKLQQSVVTDSVLGTGRKNKESVNV